jgi:hypothetical protein
MKSPEEIMKRVAVVAAGCLLLAVVESAQEPRPAQQAFDKLKTLVGEWQGVASGGQKAKVTYRLVSNGSALVEDLAVGADETMVTIYHLDGDRLMATHYCGAGNQPRMVSTPEPKNPNVITFKFLDATNLSSADVGHMRDLVVTFADIDHFTQQWTWREKGKPDQTEVFKLTRLK